jgi:ketosteroid isomerase-like protein
MSDANLRAVKEVYAAYERGDLEAVLARLAEDVVWANPYPAHVPLSGEFRGHEGIRRFVSTIKGSSESLAFEPREFIAQGEQVVVLGWERVRARPTGRIYENAWVHVWTLRGGKASSVRVFGDTAAVSEAFRAP